MKGFVRGNLLLPLCGLNCGFCPIRLDKRCPGCGGGEGNQSCRIARCSLEHGNVPYCGNCSRYPCEKYQHFDDFDSFITHRRRSADMARLREIGERAYIREQLEKEKTLRFLLANFNDGRRKTFFCAAVNMLELPELRKAVRQLAESPVLGPLTLKEKAPMRSNCFSRRQTGRGLNGKSVRNANTIS